MFIHSFLKKSSHMLKKQEIDNILNIAKYAGDIILEYYQGYKDLSSKVKKDNSVVTQADLSANDYINNELKSFFPDFSIVSEENDEESNFKAVGNNKYFIIDPLDGTSSFVAKSDEFTVNIAIIENKQPIFGAIFLPVKDIMYYTDENHKSCKIENYSKNGTIQHINSSNNKDDLIVICTKREPEKSEIIADIDNKNIKIKELISVSSSYKFCLIAEGKADLYPRKVNIKAWDVAAGHAIVSCAGGSMINSQDQKELEYDIKDSFDIAMFEVF